MKTIPPNLLSKKPKPLFCLATERETQKPYVFYKFEPDLSQGSGRKWSMDWWNSRYWSYGNSWTNWTPYKLKSLLDSKPYWCNYMEIRAESEEEALNVYKSKVGNN